MIQFNVYSSRIKDKKDALAKIANIDKLIKKLEERKKFVKKYLEDAK